MITEDFKEILPHFHHFNYASCGFNLKTRSAIKARRLAQKPAPTFYYLTSLVICACSSEGRALDLSK